MTTAAQVGITGIDATYYMTKDLTKSTPFYTALFGFEPQMQVPETVSEWTLGDDTTFGLYQPSGGDADDMRLGGGILFHVGDLSAAKNAATSLGAKFDDHVEETPMCYMAFGEDPEGNRFILHQSK